MFTGTSPIARVHTHYTQDALSYKIWCSIFTLIIHTYVAKPIHSGDVQARTQLIASVESSSAFIPTKYILKLLNKASVLHRGSGILAMFIPRLKFLKIPVLEGTPRTHSPAVCKHCNLNPTLFIPQNWKESVQLEDKGRFGNTE